MSRDRACVIAPSDVLRSLRSRLSWLAVPLRRAVRPLVLFAPLFPSSAFLACCLSVAGASFSALSAFLACCLSVAGARLCRSRLVLGVVGVSRLSVLLQERFDRWFAVAQRAVPRFVVSTVQSRSFIASRSAFSSCRPFSRGRSSRFSRSAFSSCRPFSRGRSSRPEALFRRVDRSVAVVHRGSPARGSPPVLAASAGTAASARPLTRRVPPRGPSLELDVDGMQPLLGCSPKK